MKLTKVLYIVIIFLLFNCKEKPASVKPKPAVEEIQEKIAAIKFPEELLSLAAFAEPNQTDTISIEQKITYKEINDSGLVKTISREKALALYKSLKKPKAIVSYPIFEINNTETAILPIKGIGFGGAIWANVLVDRHSLEIKKIEFDHAAESSDYGAPFTQNSFENQFVGKRINFSDNMFFLRKQIEIIEDDGHVIDGLAAATMTSSAAVKMVNEGLQRYRNYLETK
ncbi:FMN-binding protein [Maribacter sp. CXY002]|uniref:FMN-binding protein n=1 Tax=Maribacter luteocoastalis TaxID=3407671 RepID=UPI003B670E5C